MPAIIPIMDSNWSCIFRSLRSTTQCERSRINIPSAAYSAALIGWESLRGLSLSCRVCHSMHGLTLRTLWIHARSHLSARSLTLSNMPGPHGFRGTLAVVIPLATGRDWRRDRAAIRAAWTQSTDATDVDIMATAIRSSTRDLSLSQLKIFYRIKRLWYIASSLLKISFFNHIISRKNRNYMR